jgi:ATP-dependent helicase/DNAse subunit B
MIDPYDAPDATLILGPAGSGKTEAALDAILAARDLSPFSTIWVLLATGQQIHAFRERLLTKSPDAAQFGVEFFDFEKLYIRLLDLLGDPQRRVEETAHFQLLRHITTRLRDQGQLELFSQIAHLPGFIGLLAGLISELKQGLVQPDHFRQVADQFGPKDRDLAKIYAAYQQFLQDRALVDRHGAGWRAVAHLQRGERLPTRVDLLVVDGFDQFNRVHTHLLAALAGQIKQTVLTLAAAPGTRQFRRFEQTRARVLESAPGLWRVQPHPLAPSPPAERGSIGGPASRPPALDHLVNTLFLGEPGSLPGDGAVRLIEAPDVGREVGAALRRIKRLLLDGVPPESIMVVARDMRRYSAALRETARAYRIPLVAREGLPLRENPAMSLLFDLIDLAALDFPRRDVLDTLRSPYLASPDLSREQIRALETISAAEQVTRGRAAWLAAIRDAATLSYDEDGEPLAEIGPVDSDILHEALRRHFERITPPERGTAYTLTRWLEALLGPDPEREALDSAEGEIFPEDRDGDDHFSVIACIRAGADAARVTRDIHALHVFQYVLSGIRAAHDLLLAGGDEPAVLSWSDFRAELGLAVEQATVTPPGGTSRIGRVLAASALDARGLPHDHVFILGLAEGVFPAQESEGALYQDGERRALEAAGIDLQTAAERADDMSLFYQMIGLARRTLTLSRFTLDDKGAPCPPSPYWHAVRASVAIPDDQIARIKTGSAPGLDEAATLSEAAVAAAAVLSSEHPDHGSIAAAQVYNALLLRWGSRWLNVLRGQAIESGRESAASPFDHFSGLLADPNLIRKVAEQLGPDHLWSASQFNDFGFCPFRFFARRVLRLEELREPEEGLDPLQLGSIYHAILERAYRQVAAEGLSITPENRDRALELLDSAADHILADAPAVYGFRASPVWMAEQDEMRRRLRWLVEHDFSADSPFRLGERQKPTDHPVAALIGAAEREPFLLEAAFGPDQVWPALVIDGPAGSLTTRGVIDRLDRAGEYVIVVDYKTGATKHDVKEMAAGRDFQMMLYLLAAQAMIADPALTVAGGLFWHIRNRKASGEVRADDEAVEAARAFAHQHVLAARQGRFPVQPTKMQGDRCAARCEFRALCRMKARRKQRYADERG